MTTMKNSNDADKGVPLGPLSLQLMKDSPVCKIKWAQGSFGERSDEAYLEVGFEDQGGGAFFYLQSEKRFYFDSGDDLRRLADIVDALLKPFSDADVFSS